MRDLFQDPTVRDWLLGNAVGIALIAAFIFYKPRKIKNK